MPVTQSQQSQRQQMSVTHSQQSQRQQMPVTQSQKSQSANASRPSSATSKTKKAINTKSATTETTMSVKPEIWVSISMVKLSQQQERQQMTINPNQQLQRPTSAISSQEPTLLLTKTASSRQQDMQPAANANQIRSQLSLTSADTLQTQASVMVKPSQGKPLLVSSSHQKQQQSITSINQLKQLCAPSTQSQRGPAGVASPPAISSRRPQKARNSAPLSEDQSAPKRQKVCGKADRQDSRPDHTSTSPSARSAKISTNDNAESYGRIKDKTAVDVISLTEDEEIIILDDEPLPQNSRQSDLKTVCGKDNSTTQTKTSTVNSKSVAHSDLHATSPRKSCDTKVKVSAAIPLPIKWSGHVLPSTKVKEKKQGCGKKRKTKGTTSEKNHTQAMESQISSQHSKCDQSKHQESRHTLDRKLDCYQKAVLDHWENERMLINAGPGAGKTFTLCRLIEHILHTCSSVRVLVLAFNRYAVAELKNRLLADVQEYLCCSDDSDRAFDGTQKICFISTFDSFAQKCCGNNEDKFKDKDYNTVFNENVVRLGTLPKASPQRTWDWLIIDEAQDVDKNHEQLLTLLEIGSQHFVAAGDPRQAVQSDSEWFSYRWQSEQEQFKIELKYNHRSGSKLVNFFNKYSRDNFEELGLHYDQESACSSQMESSLLFEPCQSDSGKIAGLKLLLSPPTEAYAITPVSLIKFGNKNVTHDIEETIRGHGYDIQRIKSLNSNRENNNAYKIGTVSSLKGTEQSRVVVYGVKRSYRPTIEKSFLAKLIYVAITRSKKHLHVIIDKKLPIDSPLRPASQPRRQVLTKTIAVTDLAKENYNCWKLEKPVSHAYDGYDKDQIPYSGISIDAEDSNFIGLYLESILADCLECKGQSFDGKPTNSQANKVNEELKKVSETREQNVNLWHLLTEDQDRYDKNKHLLRSLKKHKADCQPFVQFMHEHLASPVCYQRKLQLHVSLHRSSKEIGSLIGYADFASESSVIEIKYVSQLLKEHKMQLSMYATMMQCHLDDVLLVNLKDAVVQTINPMPRQELINFTRAKLALQNIRQAQNQQQGHTEHIIAISQIQDDSGQICEIAGVAFSLGREIFGTYHEVLPGVEEYLDRNSQSEDTGFDGISFQQAKLIISNPERLKHNQDHALKNFKEWIQSISHERIIVIWNKSTSDKMILRLTELARIFSIFTTSGHTSLTLSECVQQTLGADWPYEPYRAFEDAVATASLFLALPGGKYNPTL